MKRLQQTLGELCDLRVWIETNLINNRNTEAGDLVQFVLLSTKYTMKLKPVQQKTKLYTIIISLKMHTQSNNDKITQNLLHLF